MSHCSDSSNFRDLSDSSEGINIGKSSIGSESSEQ